MGNSVRETLSSLIDSHGSGRALRRLWDNLDRHNAALAASAMAFDAFLSLVPLTAFAGWMLFTFHQKSSSITLIFGPILSASPEGVSQLVTSEFLRLSDRGAAAVAPISLIVFLWVTSGGLATAMGVFETMYARQPRPWVRRRVLAIGFVLAGVAVIATVGTLALMVVAETPDAFGRWLAIFLAIAMVFFLVYAFYRYSVSTSERRRKTRYLVPGALLTVGLWAATSILFSLYVTRLSRYATLYGNLATVAILLFWLWLLSLSLLVGAEVNAELEKAAMRRAGEPTTSRPSQW
jgi:membrane protein